MDDKIREAFKRSWHYKSGCHHVENSNKYTIFVDGYKAGTSDVEKLEKQIANDRDWETPL